MRLTLLEVLRGRVHGLERDELEAAGLEAADDVPDKPALDAVGLEEVQQVSGRWCTQGGGTRLDHDVGALGVVGHRRGRYWGVRGMLRGSVDGRTRSSTTVLIAAAIDIAPNTPS